MQTKGQKLVGVLQGIVAHPSCTDIAFLQIAVEYACAKCEIDTMEVPPAVAGALRDLQKAINTECECVRIPISKEDIEHFSLMIGHKVEVPFMVREVPGG